MQHCTFKQAKQYVARGSGECSDWALGEIVNTIRRHFFGWYHDLPLFLDAVESFAVQTFCFDHVDPSRSYRGITLPREAQNVEAMWLNGWPLRLESSWREFQTGISAECDCRLQKIDLPGAFSTALDIQPGAPTRLRVTCLDIADEGKSFTVRGIAGHAAAREQTFILSSKSQLTDEVFALIEPRGGVVKETTVGRVVLAQESGRVLGIYEPDETVPSYRRVKLTGLPDDCDVVNVRSARRYFPLVGDNDVVEMDNEPAFDAMARYLRIYRKGDKTELDLKTEQTHLATARAHVLGDVAREHGKGTRAEVQISMPTFGGPRLHRTGRGFGFLGRRR